MKKVFYNIFVFSIPVFLLFTLYSQMCATKVVDIHSSIKHVTTVSSDSYRSMDISTGMVLIPSSEPVLEMIAVNDLFQYMKAISDSYSGESAYKVLSEVEEVYSDALGSKSSLFTNAYEMTVRDIIKMFKDYSMFGKDSTVYSMSKSSLESSLQTLKMISMLKIVTFVVLLVCAIVGVVLLRVKYTRNLSHK